jgi:TATA-binding protein-associated factor Taf7
MLREAASESEAFLNQIHQPSGAIQGLFLVILQERDRGTQRERQRERETERQRQTERQTDREREGERQRETETEESRERRREISNLEPAIKEAPLELQRAIERRFPIQDFQSITDPNPVGKFLSIAHVNTSSQEQWQTKTTEIFLFLCFDESEDNLAVDL